MSTFEATRSQNRQEHITIIELDLPCVDGTCTIGTNNGYGTPQTCDQVSNGTKTYKFTFGNAPILPESDIHRCIKSINETPTKLQSGKGLASRGTLAITFMDFIGDPNLTSPALLETPEIKQQGTFFGKLDVRNVFANREVRIKNYRVEQDGTIDLALGAETRYYLCESITPSSKGSYSLNCKDELSRINKDETVFPIPIDGVLRTSIDDTTTTIPVDAIVTYLDTDTIRINDELMQVISVSNIGTASATLTVKARNAQIFYTNFISEKTQNTHTAGDAIFVCDVSDNETINTLIERVMIAIGFDPLLLDTTEWTNELLEWHPTTRINTLHLESIDTAEILEKILTSYLVDMWFDPVERLVKLSAISVWKESTASLTEGREIDYGSITRKKVETLRATRSVIVFDKKYLASSDDIENYSKASRFVRSELETADLFGESKLKSFENNSMIDKDSADLVVQRYTSRFISPEEYSWTTQERFLTFKLADVVDIDSTITQGFNGLSSTSTRAQITSIKPTYKNGQREYKINALTYEPSFTTGSEITITGNVSEINLFIQYAGAPSSAVDITFIFDNVTSSSTDSATPAIIAGAFPTGSVITIIMINGSDLQAKGGNGGNGQGLFYDGESRSWIPDPATNGKNGSTVYDAQGVDTEIYFSGTIGVHTADGYIRAPSGGAGGFDGSTLTRTGGTGGDGGAGINEGLGGAGGLVTGFGVPSLGVAGNNGGSTSGWGLAGRNNNALGGLAGSGIIDNGATVNLHGENSTRYINGNGDH